jgi:magnesium transporter
VRIAGTANLFPARRPPPGARPGAFVVPEDAHPTRVRAVIWDADRLEERAIHGPEDLKAATEEPGRLTWIEVVGLGDGSVLAWIRDVLGVHPLAVADIANVPQRPKFEDYGDRDLVIAQHVRILEDQGVEMTQVSLVASPHWVVSVLEEPCDELFSPLEERLRTQAPIRRMGADYLAYAMIDAVIDGYFPVLESLGELLEELEEEITAQPGRDALVRLHAVRRVLTTLHRTMWRQRDALSQILRGDEEPFGEAVRVYFRDAHDHALQVLDAIESYREVTVGLMDVYLSSVSNRLNEVVKTLTIISSIFIPLTFIVGVYGMNFDWMPELRWRWSYPVVWVVMIAVSLLLLWWFRRRGWLGDADRDDEERGDDR